jgi:hypothetical protein
MKLSEKIKIMLEMEKAKSPKKSDLADYISQASSNVAHGAVGGATINPGAAGGATIGGLATLYALHKAKPHIDAFTSAHPKLTTALKAGEAVAGLGGLAYIAHKKGWLKKKKQEQENE